METKWMFAIKTESDITNATTSCLHLCTELGMSNAQACLLAACVSELSTNIVRYADKGEVRLHIEAERFFMVVQDRGPGIADVSQAMEEGFSGGSGLGVGLSGVNRAMDDFRIETEVGKGTTVYASKAVHIPEATRHALALAQQLPVIMVDHTIILKPYPGETSIGDGGLGIDVGAFHFLALWDVSGHGAEAAALSKQVHSFLRLNCHQAPDQLLQSLHQRFLGTRGLVAVVSKLDSQRGKLEYAGIGNMALLHQRKQVLRRLCLQEGVIGYQIRTPKLQTIQLEDEDRIIMHSDGVASIRQALPIQQQQSAIDLSRHILRHHQASQQDDIACLVMRYNTSHPPSTNLEAAA